jgi:hypothetical protein
MNFILAENTELGGDSKLEAGLRFSKDVVLSVNSKSVY